MPSTLIQHRLNMPMALFVGPQRAGTSWLHRYFQNRRDMCLPKKVKEIFFFDSHDQQDPESYLSHFDRQAEHILAMEVSTTYFSHSRAPKRILDYFGKNVKLVCPLRCPIERSFSLYNHLKRYGLVYGSLQEACEQRPDILDTSRYSKHLQNWFAVFETENIYICFQEDLAADQDKFMKNICAFLHIPFQEIDLSIVGYTNVSTQPPIQMIANLSQKICGFLRQSRLYWVINFAKNLGLKPIIFGKDAQRTPKTRMSEEDRQYLVAQLGEERGKLENLLGYAIAPWRCAHTPP